MDTERMLVDGATVYLIWQQNKILALQGPQMPPANWSERIQRAERYWPLIAMALLATAIWLQPVIYGNLAASGNPGPVLLGWLGGTNQALCNATVDGSQLQHWKGRYHVVLVCGINDPTIDALDDTRITVSRSFSIQQGAIVITASYSKEMADGLKALIDAALKGAPKGSAVQWNKWYRVALLPTDSNVADIHRLSDIPRYGGTIIEQTTLVGCFESGKTS